MRDNSCSHEVTVAVMRLKAREGEVNEGIIVPEGGT